VADIISWVAQCQVKVQVMLDALGALMGAKARAAGADGDSGGQLGNCASVASEMLRELEAFKAQQFQVWPCKPLHRTFAFVDP
jgi:hypothetical protein